MFVSKVSPSIKLRHKANIVRQKPWILAFLLAIVNGAKLHARKLRRMYFYLDVLTWNIQIALRLCHQDAVHITAILGESVVFNCHVEFPGEHPVPYVLQWEKKVGDKVR
uniref:Uncharacterized protein n=1 Tax=Vespula pensylvanica TaxID=30213 RepID=A0A834NQH6_VESPE|nr:hypothetical protein H0235_012275 [Vespula pensylvanica]